ncbi:hypothetical protein XENORESO_003976 [Xenotaenia resolanae]|uniref:Uncharacterized protein n=1 Tax=Xenotaenia resolanae TaxID=208358 RepID=A0ABV0W2K2_9TELE
MMHSFVTTQCNLRHDGVSYSTPTTSSSTSGSDNTIGIFVSGTGVGCVRSSRQVMVVTETDRAGSCCTPLCSQLQPQRTASAAAVLTPNHNSLTFRRHADPGSAHKDTQTFLPLTD